MFGLFLFASLPVNEFKSGYLKLEQVGMVRVFDKEITPLEALNKCTLDQVVKSDLEFLPYSNYWIFFRLTNNSSAQGLKLFDNMQELSKYTDAVYFIKDNEVIPKYATEEPYSILNLSIGSKETSIVALRIVTKESAVKCSLKITSIDEFKEFSQLIKRFMAMPYLIFFYVMVWIGLSMMLLNWSNVLFYLFFYVLFDLFKGYLKYGQIVGLFEFRYLPIASNILFIFQVISFLMLVQNLYIEHIRETCIKILNILRYILYISMLLTLFMSSYTLFPYYLTYLIYMLALFMLVCLSIRRVTNSKAIFDEMFLSVGSSVLTILLILKLIYKSEFFLVGSLFNISYFNIIPYAIFFGVVVYRTYTTTIISRGLEKNTNKVLQAFSNSNNLNEVLEKFVTYSNRYIDHDVFQIYLRDEKQLYLYSSSPHCDLDDISKLLKEVSKGNILVVKDTKSELAEYDISVYASLLAVPMKFFGKELGYIVFLNTQKNAFSGIEVEIAEDLSKKMSLLVDGYRQNELINLYDKQRLVDEGIRVFQMNTAHDIKAPLRALHTAVAILKQRYSDDAYLMKIGEHISEAANDALEQVNESMSVVSEMDSDFDITFLSSQLYDLKRVCESEKIEVEELSEFPNNFKFLGPKKCIRNILRGVFKNAVEALENYSKDNKKIQIKYFQDEKGIFSVSIEDNGRGIKQEHMKSIFTNFSYGKPNGTGQGLSLAKSICDRLGGEITIDSCEDEYTKVIFKLDILNKKDREY